MKQLFMLVMTAVLTACVAAKGGEVVYQDITTAMSETAQQTSEISPTMLVVEGSRELETPMPILTLVPTLEETVPGNIVGSEIKTCQRPPDDLERVEFKGVILNARTLWMLNLADALYSGRGDPLRVVQGSYTNAVSMSFGTHSGGGAVDISIRVKENPSEVMSIEEAEDLVLALRRAGFAAWLRLPDDLSPGTALHIHAIAVGDPELSPEALAQLIGPEGYFRGLDGIPPAYGGPRVDRYGGPIVCPWMNDLGFEDLRP